MQQRTSVLSNFEASSTVCVLLMSIKAGGQGLNLVFCENVFLMDPWWNPHRKSLCLIHIFLSVYHFLGSARMLSKHFKSQIAHWHFCIVLHHCLYPCLSGPCFCLPSILPVWDVATHLQWCLLYSVEEQAIARVHRIGQTRAVHVTRLIVQDSVEENILEMQERKKGLSENALGDIALSNIASKGQPAAEKIRDLRLLFQDKARQRAPIQWHTVSLQ